MANSTLSTLANEGSGISYDYHDLTYVDMDLVLYTADACVVFVALLSALSNTAVFITLGKLPNVKNYSPVRLLQMLVVYQAGIQFPFSDYTFYIFINSTLNILS